MSFKEEIYSHYIDSDGLVTLDRDPAPWSTGNPQLYTGIFYALLALRDELGAVDCLRYNNAIKGCEVTSGVYNKNPHRPDLISPDEYVGIVTGSYFCSLEYCLDVYNFGDKNDWCFDNTKPGNKALNVWHGRFPGRIAFYSLAAGIGLSFYESLSLNSAIQDSINRRTDDVSPQLLMWCITRVCKHNKILPVDVQEWEDSIVKSYGSVSEMFGRYFPKGHPFIEAATL